MLLQIAVEACIDIATHVAAAVDLHRIAHAVKHDLNDLRTFAVLVEPWLADCRPWERRAQPRQAAEGR